MGGEIRNPWLEAVASWTESSRQVSGWGDPKSVAGGCILRHCSLPDNSFQLETVASDIVAFQTAAFNWGP